MGHRLAKNQIAVLDGVNVIEETAQRTNQPVDGSEANSDTNSGSGSRVTRLCRAPITIFALPKPFVGDTARIQSNAFLSWMQLSPAVDVLLIGDEEGIGEFATDNNIAHVKEVERNVQGTPLVSNAFSVAHEVSSSEILVYCNADVILDESFVRAMELLSEQSEFEQWLGIGQRTDLRIDRSLNFEDDDDLRWLKQHCISAGEKSSHVCKEYFAFTRGLFNDVPPFAVGRGNWDNWMVASVKPRGVPVIDLSKQITAIHQSHDYSHMQASRMNCYVNGEEALENQRLAAGRNLISGAICTHRLSDDGVGKIGLVRSAIDIAQDMPRFAKLMIQLLLGR